jgi:hypothetical protein
MDVAALARLLRETAAGRYMAEVKQIVARST